MKDTTNITTSVKRTIYEQAQKYGFKRSEAMEIGMLWMIDQYEANDNDKNTVPKRPLEVMDKYHKLIHKYHERTELLEKQNRNLLAQVKMLTEENKKLGGDMYRKQEDKEQ